MRVIVFGASGVQGLAQVKELVRAGHQPVAVSRHPKPISVDGTSVETAAADFTNRADIARVLRPSGPPPDRVFLNLPSNSFQQAEPILAAARMIGEEIRKTPSVALVVFNTSMPVPATSHQIDAPEHRRQIRDGLRAQGIALVSVEPVVYLENLLEGWALPPILARGTVVYCHKPTLRASWITHIDLARLMIAAAERPHLAGRNFAVGGPEAVRLAELTERLSRGWGRPLQHENQSVPDFCRAMGDAMRQRSSQDVDHVVSEMFRAYTYYNDDPSEPFNIDMAPVLRELPVQLTTIEDWARLTTLPTETA